MSETPPPPAPPSPPGPHHPPEPAACMHPMKHEGLCPDCGACDHEVVLNGTCFICGSDELDPIAMSPKKVDPSLVPADRLRRR